MLTIDQVTYQLVNMIVKVSVFNKNVLLFVGFNCSLDFIKCIIQKSLTFMHFLVFLSDAGYKLKSQTCPGKILTYGNPTPHNQGLMTVYLHR